MPKNYLPTIDKLKFMFFLISCCVKTKCMNTKIVFLNYKSFSSLSHRIKLKARTISLILQTAVLSFINSFANAIPSALGFSFSFTRTPHPDSPRSKNDLLLVSMAKQLLKKKKLPKVSLYLFNRRCMQMENESSTIWPSVSPNLPPLFITLMGSAKRNFLTSAISNVLYSTI